MGFASHQENVPFHGTLTRPGCTQPKRQLLGGLRIPPGKRAFPRRTDKSGLIVGGFSTVNESVDVAIDTVLSEWNRIANEGVSQEELQTAKTYLK